MNDNGIQGVTVVLPAGTIADRKALQGYLIDKARDITMSGEEHQPMFFFLKKEEDKEILFIALVGELMAKDKDQVAQFGHYMAEKVDACMVAFICEGWMARSKDEKISGPVKDMANAQEILSISVEDYRGEDYFVFIIEEKSNGERHLVEEPKEEGTELKNRFSGFLKSKRQALN